MNNPTCPQCNQPASARQATLFAGQVAILLECDCQQVVGYVPVSRFANPDFSLSKSQLWQMSDSELSEIRGGLGDFLDTGLEPDARRLNQRIGAELDRRSEYGF